MYTEPLEFNTRTMVDIKLKNLGWELDEKNPSCNVFKGHPRTREEQEKLKGTFPDYVLYGKDFEPIAVIEAKRPNESLEKAKVQAFDYAEKIQAPVVFVTDDTFVESVFVANKQPLKVDGEELQDFVDQLTILRFINENTSEILSILKNTPLSRTEVLKRFRKANDILREEGLRQGYERFTALADLLFLKLFDENEQLKEHRGQKRLLEAKYTWSEFKDKKSGDMLDFIKDSVWTKLRGVYPHLFKQDFLIKKPEVLKEIIKELDFNLSSTDADIKGEAFEFFLKNVTNGNKDLGEYYTPRHIARTTIKLLKPKFGETIYDPFCGTGGFLIEAFKYLRLSVDDNEDNIKFLREKTLIGREITSTARIAQMNLVLFDDGKSNIEQKDSLQNPIKSAPFVNKQGETEWTGHNIVVTNIPYSQKTKYGKLYDVSVSEKEKADIACVQHVWDACKPGGRGAIIVPETFLYEEGKTEKVRKLIVDNSSKLSIISLPRGVFLPYTPTKTNIVYFEKRNEKTKDHKNTFFFVIQNDGFELGGRRRPLKGSSDLKDLLSESEDFKINPPKSNLIPFTDVKTNNYNLRPFFYMEDKIESDRELIYLGDIIEEVKDCRIDPTAFPDKEFKLCSVSQDGIFLDEIKQGITFTQDYNVIHKGDLSYNPHRINIGSIGITPSYLDGGLVSKIYPVFRAISDIPAIYIQTVLKQPRFLKIINNYCLDSARSNLPVEELKRIAIPKPTQKEIESINEYNKVITECESKTYYSKIEIESISSKLIT